jgi:hypothetical protein
MLKTFPVYGFTLQKKNPYETEFAFGGRIKVTDSVSSNEILQYRGKNARDGERVNQSAL